jgi:hypothetical protein
MASSYAGFGVNYEDDAGKILSVGPGVLVHVYDTSASADSADSPLTTDSDGNIGGGLGGPGGTLSDVAVGTTVHFRVENFNGMAFSYSQVTT